MHKPGIDALDALGLFDGTECGEGLFCPGEEMKRWTMGVWLVRALGDTDPPAVEESSFADVDSGEWWLPFAERLAALEITKGCKTEPLSYCPNKPVNRAQMATFLARALGLIEVPTSALEEATSTAPEDDEPPLPATAFQAVSAGWSHTCGLRVSGAIVCWGDNTSRAADAADDSYSGVGAGA